MHPLEAAYKRKQFGVHSPYGRRPFSMQNLSVGAAARHGIFSSDRSADGRTPSPYALNFIKTPDNPDAPILAGRTRELEDQMKQDRNRELRWTAEVVVSKAYRSKLRGITLSVWEPQAAPHDVNAFASVGDMMAHRKERQQYNSGVVFYARGLLEELKTLENKDHDSVILPEGGDELAAFKRLNFTVEEFIKVLMDIPNLAKSEHHPAPDDGTLIRLTLDTFYGYVMNLGQLKTDIGQLIVRTFLNDSIELFSNDGRLRVFDARQEKYVQGSEELFRLMAKKVEAMPKYGGVASFRDDRNDKARHRVKPT